MSNKYLSAVGRFIRDKIGWKAGTAFVVGFILGMFAGVETAEAATGNVTITPATTYSDGTPLSPSDIAAHNVRCRSFTPTGGVLGSCPAHTPLRIAMPSLAGVISVTIPAAGGTLCFEGNTELTAARGGTLSTWVGQTNPCKVVPPLVPDGPAFQVVSISVTIGGQVVRIDPVPAFGVLASGARSTAVYGFVRAGTPAVGGPVLTYRGESYCRVARQNVGWWRTAANDNAIAPCRT